LSRITGLSSTMKVFSGCMGERVRWRPAASSPARAVAAAYRSNHPAAIGRASESVSDMSYIG
jgi:hypothetical protein